MPLLDYAAMAALHSAGPYRQFLVADFDTGAADFVEANGPVLQPVCLGETRAEFEKLAEGYAFVEAQAMLELGLKRLPAAGLEQGLC